MNASSSFSSAAHKQSLPLSALDPSLLPHALSSSYPNASSSAAALPIGDPAALKAQLAEIVNGTQSGDPKIANRSLIDLHAFFESVTEQSGSAVQTLFGQHVANNVFFVVMDAVVKPAFTRYCSVSVTQRRTRAVATHNTCSRSGTTRTLLNVAAIVNEEMDALNNAKAQRLRSDIARPFRALVEILHMNLPTSLLCGASHSSGGGGGNCNSNSNSSGSVNNNNNNNNNSNGPISSLQNSGIARDVSSRRGQLDDSAVDGDASLLSSSLLSFLPPALPHHTSAAEIPQRWWASAPNYSALPLLWKQAVPLHTLTKHALEVMQSEVLYSICGAEYAQLLLRLFLYDGYLAALQPGFMSELAGRLLRLIETTAYEPGTNPETMISVSSLGHGYENIGHETLDGHGGMKWQTTVDDGTTYAALLAQLLRAPHFVSSLSPCEDTNITPQSIGRELTVPLLLHSLMRLTTQRHARSTSALRLEAHLLVALNQLVSAARHDYPLACAAPLEIVKLLCHYFYSTARRDGWRMESLSFMTTQLCASFSAVLGQCVRFDIESTQQTSRETYQESQGYSNAANSNKHNHDKKKHNSNNNKKKKNDGDDNVDDNNRDNRGKEDEECQEQGLQNRPESKEIGQDPLKEVHTAPKKSLKCEKRQLNDAGYAGSLVKASSTTTVPVPPHCLTLLHKTVLPFALRLFAVARSEFSHISRRELFYFPCPKLAPLFDFGAVVLYLACRTHMAYVSLPAAASVSADAQVRKRHRSDSETEAKETNAQPCDDSVNRAQGEWQPHPSTEIIRLFRSFFFLDGSTQRFGNISNTRELPGNNKRNNNQNSQMINESYTHVNSQSNGDNNNNNNNSSSSSSSRNNNNNNNYVNPERGGGFSLGAAATATGTSLSAAAVQDLVSDGSLFLLHLLAQPAVALGIGPSSCAHLVEDCLLPLFPHYGVRLEGLLLAALEALAPRAGLRCEQNVFRWLLRRYVPSPTTQRDDESQPKEAVYRLLATLLDRTTSRAPMHLNAEEKDRLIGAAHFATVATRVRAAQAVSAVNNISSGMGMLNTAPTASAGVGGKGIGIGMGTSSGRAAMSSVLFQSMLRFLSALHMSLSSGCILEQGTFTPMLPSSSFSSLPSAPSSFPLSFGSCGAMTSRVAVEVSTGVSFVFSCLSHAIFFFSPDEGIAQPCDTAADAAARYFLSHTMRYIESYLVATSALLAVDGNSGWTAHMHAHGRHSGKVAASLQRMHQFILYARQSARASSMSPAAHMPSSVCDAAEGHWLLLPPFLPSVVDVQALHSMTAHAASALLAYDIANNNNNNNDNNDNDNDEDDAVCAGNGPLRRGDVPAIIVETIANVISSVVVDFSLRAKSVRTAHGEKRDITNGSDADMMLCVQAAQLLHTLARLFRIGIWHLPLAGTSDIATLESAVPLFDNPSNVLLKLSAEGKLYYIVMWTASYISLYIPRLSHRDRPLLRVLAALFDDVGSVLLAQSFALWEPRQTVIGLAGAICRRALDDGITRVATYGSRHSTAHTANSEVDVLYAQDITRLSCKLLGSILAQARHSRIIHAAADPLVEPSLVCQRVTKMLVDDGLLMLHGEAATKLNPFLPASLPVIDALAGLLQVLHEECGDSKARRAVRELLTTLFARYRHSMAEGIFLAFGFYAPKRRMLTSAMLRDTDAVSDSEDAANEEGQRETEMKNMTTTTMMMNKGPYDNDDEHNDVDVLGEQKGGKYGRVGHLNQTRPQKQTRADVPHRQKLTTMYTDGCSLLLEEGRLLASFVDQLTDTTRVDMPVMTVQSQCAVLSSIYGLLFRCESAVAEKLGKYLFSFLSVTTPYAVRRHTALHVRYLFTRFTHRAFAVLHELLYRGREGIASLNPMLCATSLRALGEAARAAPMMEPAVISTLLECWATRGFAHRGLLTECLELIGNTMNAKEVCHYHCEKLLFDWLWRLGYSMEAFPVVCFGYTCLADMSRELLPTLLPLAVLCSARRCGVGHEGGFVPHTRAPTAGVDDNEGYFCPNGLLWRLVASNSSEGPERSPTQLVDCLVMNFSDVMARLLAFAALPARTRQESENTCGNVNMHEVAEAAKISIEWMRSTFMAHRERTDSDFVSLLRLHGDGILCRLISLVGADAPMPIVPQLRKAVTLYCSLAETSMDDFFSSDAGDHAYVLLQHIYACAMGGLTRAPRRALLTVLFEQIIRQWWGRRVLLVPHVAHTVLRMSANLLMSCPAERPLVCDVLLYTWTVLTSSDRSATSVASCSRQLVAADEAFLSTVMLALAEESRAVASTWAAICRTDSSLQRWDWLLQHSQYAAAGGDVINVDEDSENENEKDADNGGEKKEDHRVIRQLLPLLRNVVLVSGDPASVYYADLASAVDVARDAFVRAIRNEQERHRERQTSGSISEALSRALRHLFAVVTANEDSDGSVAAALQHSLISFHTATGVAGMSPLSTCALSGPRDALLAAFDLLRAISWCFIEAGAEQLVDALLSPMGAMERQMQQEPLDTVLHTAYRRHLEQLYRLAFDSDTKLAAAAAVTLRGWLCGTVRSVDEADDGMSGEKSTKRRRVTGEEVTIMQQTLASMEQSEKEKKQQDEQKQKPNRQEDVSGLRCVDVDGIMGPMLRLEDLLPFRRQPFGLPPPHGVVILDESDTIAASIASLQDENVWDALRVYADESRFLRFFLISLFRHYGLQHRLPTVAAVLSGLLLPTASGEYNRRRVSFFETFLPIALLHVMLLRETETQRALREQWSRKLQETLFAHAAHFPHTARLFLRAINVCRAAVMSVVRGRGIRPDGSKPHALARMNIKSEDTPPFTFPLFPRSAYGELMELSDMRESYWLCDLDPLVLASAAVACHEPHLAILFADLSGESLLGRRKGIPASQFQSHMHYPHQSQQFFSVLFPSVQRPTTGMHLRTGLQRVEKAQADVAERLFAFRTAVHAVHVDADAAWRLRDCGSVEQDGTNLITGSARTTTTVAGDGDDANSYTTPWEEAFLMRHPLRRIEREKNRGNWQMVLALLDDIERSRVMCHTQQHREGYHNTIRNKKSNMDRGDSGDEEENDVGGGNDGYPPSPPPPPPRGGGYYNSSAIHANKSHHHHHIDRRTNVAGLDLHFSPVHIAVERANALMHLGANGTAIHILSAALKSHVGSHSCPSSSLVLPGSTSTIPSHCSESLSGDDVSLRSAMAAALWRCGRWDDEEMLFQHQRRPAASVAPISVNEGLFFALSGLHRGEPQEARRWSFLAQRQLARQMDPTNWLRTLLRAEALHNVAELSNASVRARPRWVHANSLSCDMRTHYDEMELLDSLRLQLSVVCQQPDWWLLQLERGAARALRGGRPLLLRQWLTTQEEEIRCLAGKEKMDMLSSTQGLPASAFLALLHARAEFATGNPHGAIAILQNVAPAQSIGSGEHSSFLSLPPEAPSMPVIVHQLIDWAKEARLVPLSQLVRDYFFSACASSDRSGACSLQLARLCHALARDIATRLRSPEYRVLQESLKDSRRTLKELQKQHADDGRSEQEKNVLLRRIRGIHLDTRREHNKWISEVENYALYRRSALNAYARFLQYSDPAGAEDDTLAVFGFVSLWLQQDEELDERTVMGDCDGGKTAPGDGVTISATAKVLRKAIENTSKYKFLPLFSQLAAQLGTSMDNENLEVLVMRIAMENPLHTVWPLLALTRGHEFGRSAAGGTMHVVDEKKVAIARRIVELMKSHTSANGQGDAWRRKVVTDAERLSAAYMQLALHTVRETTKSSHRIPPGFSLTENIKNLSIPPPTITIPSPLTLSQSHALPRIARYETEFTTPGGINVPKALRCVLDDGQVVRQLLKSEDDLRQDSLIEQVFCLSNELLAREKSTRLLRLYTYNVVPLAPTVGIIEWADGTVSFGHYLTGSSGKWPTGAHERYFPDEPNTHDCRNKLRGAGKDAKHDTLLSIYAEFTPALHYFFLEHFFTPQEWLERRDAYTRSVAAASIVGYIVGLGDRHGSNLLLHTRRAELVHIDLGFAFDQAKLLPVPELVPFRLTRNIVDGLGVQGADGPLRRHCEGTLRVMRGRRELLLTILEACAHDPLARWAVTVAAAPSPPAELPQENTSGARQGKEGEEGGEERGGRGGGGVRRGKATYAEAERTLARVAEKIQGYEAGELLSVSTHVQNLLQAAQNTELLSCMFDGWSPWL